MKARHRSRGTDNRRGDPFARIEAAADAAVDEVLEEDRLLRVHGIFPESGRSR